MSDPSNYTAINTVYTTITDVADLLAPKSIFQTGGIWTWGLNTSGQLGNNSTVDRSSPASVIGGMRAWRSVSMGGYGSHVGGIKTDGTLWLWGLGSYGRLADNTTTSKSSPVTVSAGGTTWKQLGLHQQGGTAIKTDGSMWGWGRNNLGQLGDNTAVNKSSPVTIGNTFDWIYCSGGNANSQGAIKQDNSLWMWGSNTNGALGDGTTTNRSSPVTVSGGGTNWKQVAVAVEHSAAIKKDGTLWTWGRNVAGELGTGTTIARSSPNTTVAGGTDWKYVAVAGNNTSNPNYATAGIKLDGTLWTWGSGAYGTIASAAAANRSSPDTVLGGGTTWKTVTAGWRAMAGIKTDGSLWTWGQNDRGQLGDGQTTTKTSPVSVIGTINNWIDAFITRSTSGGTAIGISSDNEYEFPIINVYKVPGTYTETIPEGFHTVVIEAWGGGGAGGARDPSNSGGGGSGAYSRSTYELDGGAGLTISISVGAGGIAGVSSGNDTTVSSGTFSITTMTAGGGNKGDDFSLGAAGGLGGLATGGNAQNTSGTDGLPDTGGSLGGGAVTTYIVTYYAYGAGGNGLTPTNGGDGAVVFKYI